MEIDPDSNLWIYLASILILLFANGVFAVLSYNNNTLKRFADLGSAPAKFLVRMTKPFVYVMNGSTNLIFRICGINPKSYSEDMIEEEIRMIMDVGEEKGVIEQSEKDMINNIFEFDDTTVEDVMTHRTEMKAVSIKSDLTEIVQSAVNFGHSRIPVFDDDIDDIVGILYVKDLLRLIITDEDFQMEKYMRKALFVPESNRCTGLFKEFNIKKIQIAIVADEYGGTAGIVTMEDLLEAIVGNIQDEYDDDVEEAFKLLKREQIKLQEAKENDKEN